MFEQWYNGILPKQIQVQRQNIVKVMTGSIMFREQERSGSYVLPFFIPP
jgi:hypothetical protein